MFDTPRLIIYGLLAVVTGLVSWQINHAFNEAAKVPGLEKELSKANDKIEAVKEAAKVSLKACRDSIKPANEANNYDYQKLTNSLNLCLDQLRKTPGKCIPVYTSKSSNGVDAASERPASGFTENAINANNLLCQADRDALNAAKIWAKGYSEYKTNVEKQ